MTHISADVQRITLNALCMTISGERTEQLDIFGRVTGFMSDFLSFIDVELIRFFHAAPQLSRNLEFVLCILLIIGCSGNSSKKAK